ncbi:ArsR family transcriptional regulator [Occultella glacieicola]|uniref:ArsR family transcriptional regulator n=1 Tax=Occultella glacieicola TaxID=2518684 RepID=A0ABY2E3P9_9MICO|nr:helix-turn-helix domain-containing protein [Occultella glacieicola]TDE94037.1 ArsR family transcriptional regulator [Occultella glacieicola]
MKIEDPRAMRALAHPLRFALLERLAIEGEATATELAAFTGSTPSNCSFHLRTLAEFGYIERAPGHTGRNRPWRVLDIEQSWDDYGPDEEAEAASRALGATFVEWETSRIKAAQHATAPEAWRGKLFQSGATIYVTAEEARAIGDEIGEIIMRYVPRWENPETRPEGGELVRVFATSYLVPEPGQPTETDDGEAS